MKTVSKQTIWQRLKLSVKAVKGYQLGALLKKLEQNLAPYEVKFIAPAEAVFRPTEKLYVRVKEQVKPLFLGHLIQSEFSISSDFVSSNEEESQNNLMIDNAHTGNGLTCQFQTTGMLKRQTIKPIIKGNMGISEQLMTLFSHYPEFYETLKKMDFTKAQLTMTAESWTFTVMHFAASEVVGRVPPIRRYIPLSGEQRQLLLSSLLMMQQLMQQLLLIVQHKEIKG
ncbi:DUF3156 family protein [Thorsellia kenyensis]|uniref:DUF3156 family protein n=1 Tax=Thorsellia kenyensis TaxID=1549888 RepID=A0ABV6CB05_9GAMM